MKKITSFVFIILSFKLNASCQDYYKIKNTSRVIRYYKNLKHNVESINDSTSIRITKKGEIFIVTLINKKGKLLASCRYKFVNEFENRVFVSRNSKEGGNELVKSKKRIKVLEPVSDNCIKIYLNL